MTPDERAELGRKIISDLNRMIEEGEQNIRDTEYWNRINPQHPPFDVESDRLLVSQLRRDRELFLQGRSLEIDSSKSVRFAREAVEANATLPGSGVQPSQETP